MSVELKPCPFCGKKPSSLITNVTRQHYISCQNEECFAAPTSDGFRSLDEAIAAWNTRSAHAVKPLEWQPIETAPKARTKENPGRRGPYILLSNDCGTWVGCHFPEYVSGYKPKNPWASMMLNVRHMGSTKGLVPTHWMPLPGPPIDTQKDEDKQ